MTRCGMFAAVVLLGVAACVSSAAAADLRDIVKEQRSIASDIEDSDVLILTPRESRIVRDAQKIIFNVTDGKQSIDDMSPDEHVQLKNALEQVRATLATTRKASEEQEVCWREKQVGSQVMKTVCGTQQERDDLRRGARDFMSKPKVCVPPGCGA